MTPTTILTKVIEKAIAGGWKQELFDTKPEWRFIEAHPRSFLSVMVQRVDSFDAYNEAKMYTSEIIYSHDFAKALWPGDMPTRTRLPDWAEPILAWRSHLQAMVVADNPLKYLEENI